MRAIFSPIYAIVLLSFLWINPTATASTTEALPNSQQTVILIHGLGRSGKAMWLLESRLSRAGYSVITLDYSSLRAEPDDIIESVVEQLDECCKHASTVHFIGHSLGGLVIRAYLAQPESQKLNEKLGRVVMMGTPNSGTQIVNHFQHYAWFHWLGPATLSLSTDPTSFPNRLATPSFQAGIIAGTNGWLASNAIFNEPNDGLVAVAETHLPNMADFIALDVSHSMMRYNKEVASQTLYFLEHGRFYHQ
ncbi:esterase/lipase family protein [Echinimonas agarilytica]|uniref:Alpha/beta fold hydrolase n=1 Tax=Echinimonas agarilytica TaxID=1215918 RepID=A0AA41W3F3_9GAMM|nr:alpha/beta fold hydrolase [Echinimonas agarilytica]MCM2678135.1 alpha/beta fold hydrolase [Echinimonas agarilytica]